MNVEGIIELIDADIDRLTQARNILQNVATVHRGPGRPRWTFVHIPKKVTKRTLSPEGRKRIADAMKRRWAERRAMLKDNKKVSPAKVKKAKVAKNATKTAKPGTVTE